MKRSSEIAERIAKAYIDEQIDSVYVIFNEFKSVIAQRLIAQRILPVQEIGRREVPWRKSSRWKSASAWARPRAAPASA